MSITARPFVKWVGGKTNLLPQLTQLLPTDLRRRKNLTYIEPFVGGGASLYHFIQTYSNISEVYINDYNTSLTCAYRMVRDEPQALIRSLKDVQSEYYNLGTLEKQEEYYYQMRDRYNAKNLSDIDTATTFMFINKTCFNALYRENRKGGFNAAFGYNPKPTICDEETILADSEVLQRVSISTGDFSQMKEYVTDSTFVYLDPPYRPLATPTSSKTLYTKAIFNDDEQRRLRDFCDTLTEKGAMWMQSNSDGRAKDPNDTFLENLYEGCDIQRVWAGRAINCNGEKRGKITELVIRNYTTEPIQPTLF